MSSDNTDTNDSPPDSGPQPGVGENVDLSGLGGPDEQDAKRGRSYATFTALANGRDPPRLDDDDAAAVGEFLRANGIAYDSPEEAAIARRQAFTGGDYGGERDVESVLGYPDPQEVTPEQYVERYERQDLAKAIVDAPVNTTWRNTPEVNDTPSEESDDETDFETAVSELFDSDTLQRGLTYYWERADRDCRLGQYSLLFFGFDDGRPAHEEVNQSELNDPDDLRYIRPIKQAEVAEWDLAEEDGEREPGLPIHYTIKVERPSADGTTTYDEKRVHYSRVIHVTDDPDATRLLSTPALEPVLRRLVDFEKVLGASAEMYWVGADRKFFFSNDTSGTQQNALGPGGGAAGGSPDYEQLDAHLREMMHGLKPALYADNMDMEVIDGQQIDPSGIIDVLYQSISAVTGIPKRILTGSERGELASSQDAANWYGHISERQAQFAEPVLIRGTLDMLVEYGILPAPQDDEYEIEWPILFEQDEKEEAETRNQTAQAIKRIENAASVSTLPRRFLYEELLGVDIPDALEDELDPEDPINQPAPGQPGSPEAEAQAEAGTDAPEQPSPDDDGGDGSGDGAVDEQNVNVQDQWNLMRERADRYATSDD